MSEALIVLMRWLHIVSMATLVGGFLYSRLVVQVAAGTLTPAYLREHLDNQSALRFRPIALLAMSGLLISGIYQLMLVPRHSGLYHAFLGIKLLLALHVFAVTLLIVRPENARRGRLTTGALISGLAIILISAYLRRIV